MRRLLSLIIALLFASISPLFQAHSNAQTPKKDWVVEVVFLIDSSLGTTSNLTYNPALTLTDLADVVNSSIDWLAKDFNSDTPDVLSVATIFFDCQLAPSAVAASNNGWLYARYFGSVRSTDVASYENSIISNAQNATNCSNSRIEPALLAARNLPDSYNSVSADARYIILISDGRSCVARRDLEICDPDIEKDSDDVFGVLSTSSGTRAPTTFLWYPLSSKSDDQMGGENWPFGTSWMKVWDDYVNHNALQVDYLRPVVGLGSNGDATTFCPSDVKNGFLCELRIRSMVSWLRLSGPSDIVTLEGRGQYCDSSQVSDLIRLYGESSAYWFLCPQPNQQVAARVELPPFISEMELWVLNPQNNSNIPLIAYKDHGNIAGFAGTQVSTKSGFINYYDVTSPYPGTWLIDDTNNPAASSSDSVVIVIRARFIPFVLMVNGVDRGLQFQLSNPNVIRIEVADNDANRQAMRAASSAGLEIDYFVLTITFPEDDQKIYLYPVSEVAWEGVLDLGNTLADTGSSVYVDLTAISETDDGQEFKIDVLTILDGERMSDTYISVQ